MQLNTVVLPAPFGPISAVMSPRADVEAEIVDGDQAAEAHGEMLDPQHSAGASPRHQPCPSLTRSAAMLLRSLRNTEGSRVEISPRGRQIMISTMAKPNSSMRYCVGSKVGPKISLEKIELAQNLGAADHHDGGDGDADLAAHAAEHDDGEDGRRFDEGEDSGEMKPCRAAKNEPAKPANIAPIAKAVSLVLVVLMPSERQAISSSRSASQARPTGSRRSRTVTKQVSSASARMR